MLFIFDMGGVVTNTANLAERISKELNISKETFQNISGMDIDSKDSLFARLSNGQISAKTFWEEFSKKSGCKILTDYWHVFFHADYIQGTVDIINSLKKKNRVVCGTNTIESHYLNHLERGDYSIFDQTYASNILGYSKPDLAFWKIILLSENVKPEEAFFIDDRIDNCEAAKSLGINTHHFVSPELLRKDVEKYF